jgi:hypothetical protein
MTTTQKKIMVVYANEKRAEQLKQELEQRKVCDIVDVYTKPKQAIEDLGVHKKEGFSSEYDYSAYIVDDNIEFPPPVIDVAFDKKIQRAVQKTATPKLAKDRENKKEIEKARERAERLGSSLKGIKKNLEGIGFYQFCKQLGQIKPGARIILLTDIENMSSKMKSFEGMKKNFETYSGFLAVLSEQQWEYALAIAIQEFYFDVGYIKKPIKSYGHVASKINQLLVTGTYQREKIYGDPEEERKAKSKKAFEHIVGPHLIKSKNGRFYPIIRRQVNVDEFKSSLQYYGQDISEKEHVVEIIKRLKSYENEAEQEVKSIQKIIRDYEDRFPSAIQDPSAFEVVKEEEQKKDKKNVND